MASSASAPRGLGKAILLGEHSVVYGHEAIAGAIEMGVECRAEPAEGNRLVIPAWDIDLREDEDHKVAKAFAALLSASGCNEPQIFHCETDLPAAAGLGSSAALCVALARCLAPTLDTDGVQELASVGEMQFHDTPSGIDVALSATGGIGSYSKADGLKLVDCPPLPIVIGLSGVERSTAAMVAGVASRMSESSTKACISTLGNLAILGHAALCEGDMASLGELMNESHRCLGKLGVSTRELDAMVRASHLAGALGAKLTGAGGGGAMIALAPGNEEKVAARLSQLGYTSIITTLGAQQ